METFAQPGGDTYFALKLTPPVARPAAAPHDVVVLFDTSASQAGDYRTKALDALSAVLAGLDAHDRVALIAVDVNAAPLTKKFVAVDGAEMRQALNDLQQRVPLGSTDMPVALRAAANACNKNVGAGRERAAIYIGDGMSTADLVAGKKLQSLVDSLVESRISVSSYAVGPRVDAELLAALANHTGGMLAVDFEEMTGRQAGNYLAEAARQPVVWPGKLQLPAAIRAIYPRRTPPLRFDRDTVVLGKLADSAAAVELDLQAEVAGKEERLHWRVTPAAPAEGHAYLSKLVDAAAADGGISLTTVGSAGLYELRRIANLEAQGYSRLSQQALATGELDQARQLAGAAARLDPMNPEAAAVLQVAEVAAAFARGQQRQASSSDLVLDGKRPAEAPGANDFGGEADGTLVDQVERQERVYVQFLKNEVQQAVNQARARMGADPEAAANELKLILEKVRQAPELDPEVRSQLVDKIEAAAQTASRQSLVKAEKDLRRQQIDSEQQARQQLVKDLYVKEEKVNQLMARFESLMVDERFRDAEAVADIANEMRPGSAELRGAVLTSRTKRFTEDIAAVREARYKGVVDSLFQVEVALVPTPDEPPILYPDPEVWKMLTERRKKYNSVDLKEANPNEAKIMAALEEKTELEFAEQPLNDVIDYLKERHAIEIQLDAKALTDAGLGSDTPVTRNLKGITLRSALRLMLSELDLTYVIRDEVLMITTKAEAENMLTNRVYPVADLVIPIGTPRPMGMGGGMGGGMLGGRGMGGGMMGGGMGGMGGGMMGGLGGGMLGGNMMGGGMGGGFFNVAPEKPRSGFRAFAVQDLKLSGKSKKAKPAGKQPEPKKPAFKAQSKAPAPFAETKQGKVAAAKPAKVESIRLEINEGDDPATAWNEYFASHQDDLAPAGSAVRKTAQELMMGRKFDQVIALINAALRNRQGQPWMFEALGLAMQAAERTPAEIERALMSALDFTSDPTDMMYLAQYMSRANLNERALQLFRQVAEVDPSAPEPFVYGLRLAQKLDDVEAIQWSTVGILSQAWPDRQSSVWEE
ncbi:MAG TPA: VWA domain-containing protein, partial [Pirellulales bacterium]|nr:VWA domain-containing protein [Pirellulales bacterium]